jgi:uncharacterized protein/heat shock protein HslJ
MEPIMHRCRAALGVLLLFSLGTRSPLDAQTAGDLAGTSWQLVRVQYMDDTIVTPDDRSKYTAAFGTDGRVSMRVDCNRGSGSWKSSEPGQLQFGPLALTRAICPPGSLHDRFVKDMTFVRSYVRKDGHLFLSLMADGGIYEFEPLPKAGGAPQPDAGVLVKNERPSFDCAKASGSVEKMICSDPSLVALDRRLADVYAAAVKKAGTPAPASLTAEQRGWLKRRNECWKEADAAGACVEREYQTRIVEIQAKSRLVSFTGPVRYQCQGPAGQRDALVVTFHRTEPPSAIVERSDRTVLAVLVPAGSGAKYEGPNLMFWERQGEAQVAWMGADLKCTAIK